MNKRILMLSAATAAVLTGSAFADTTVTTVQDKVLATSTAGNITISSGGGIKGGSSTAALITIDSSNTVVNSGVLTTTASTTAVGYLIDASKNATGSLDNGGTLDMTAGGTGNRGIYLSAVNGVGSFTGPISFDANSVVKIVGDTSTAMYFDAGTTLNGDVTMDGTVTMTRASGSTSTSTSSIGIGQFLGTINGNVTLDGTLSAVGSGASGIAVLGNINGCNTAAVMGCAEIGTLSNEGTLSVSGITTRSINSVNPESDAALVVQGSIAGGIVNDGPTAGTGATSTTSVASITSNGTTNPTVLIESLTVANTPMTIGKDTLDSNAPTSSFINRGIISAAPVDPANTQVNVTRAIAIAGQSATAPVNFTGDFFSSGLISAAITTITPAPANGGNITATALEIQNYVNIPDIHISGQSSGAFNGAGDVVASASGTAGSLLAQAILINGIPTTGGTVVTTVPNITIDVGASVSASATFQPTTNDLTGRNITALQAGAIIDESNSLHEIDNAGTISAVVTQNLRSNLVGVARAVDVSADATIGLHFNNSGNVIGDVLFGGGDDIYSIQGAPNKLATQTGEVDFATGNDQLIVGSFANVAGIITSVNGTLDVSVAQNGVLSVDNVINGTGTTQYSGLNLKVSSLKVAADGELDVTVSQDTSAATPVIQSSGQVTFDPGANFTIRYGSFIPTGGTFTLIQAPDAAHLSIADSDVTRYNSQLSNPASLPYLFQTLDLSKNAAGDALQLTVIPKTVAQLGITGYGAKMFPFANVALTNDNALGAAMVLGVNNQKEAQQAYDAFAPNASGGERAIAVSLTDQATGIVAARLRQLRLFDKTPGDLTLWGNEFAEELSNKGQNRTVAKNSDDNPGLLAGYKDHGFGFSLGLDGGSPEGGWFGGAFTFYTGDVQEGGDRLSRLNSLWYLLTGYSEWRGRGLFFESQVNVGYASFKGKRFIELTLPGTPSTGTSTAIPPSTFTREADSNRPGIVGSLGATAGAMLNYGSIKLIPQISLDGMTFREEGYTEANGGQGFDLKVNPYYANSLRIFLGSEVREDVDLGDFLLQPSARVGYRFDFLNDPVKLHAQFADVSPSSVASTPGNPFTITGPDPGQGNIVLGGALNATTDSWTFGLNYDFVRGSNNATQQIGTISLLGRI